MSEEQASKVRGAGMLKEPRPVGPTGKPLSEFPVPAALLRPVVIQPRSSQPCCHGLKICDFQHDRGMTGAFRFKPDLQAESRTEMPFKQSVHGPSVRAAFEQQGEPPFGAAKI